MSGLLWPGGPPVRLIDAAEAQQTELEGVLARSKFAGQLAKRGLRVADLFDGYAALVVLVKTTKLPQPTSRDPDDDAVLACAIAAQADAVVSGDADLLALGRYQGIPIITTSQAVERIGTAT